ncbi:hypothetical protein GCM10009775_30100 [Microbacterium aoyamense]|uniref:HTH marR-type domain-containing protein n=1 Tax=Microbacterium aoyamense TaxID=344166 RepID=A0ABN2PZP7_9MICO|nr:MarR family transcriptional regulator [Microbacterium aoyamense]
MDHDEATQVASRAVERLRLAEARLARRRQTDCGPSETARAAMRFVWEKSDAGDNATPTEIAEHVGISTPSVTSMLNRLHAGGMISFIPNPADGRSKLVVPYDRSVHPDEIDPLGASIRSFAEDLGPDEAAVVAQFVERLIAAIDLECT